MHPKLKLIALFWGPSVNGGVFTVLLAIVMLAVANFSYVLRSGLLYDGIFGKGTPYDFIQSSRDSVATLNQSILGNPALNKILFIGFWLLIGSGVCAIILTFGHSLAETGGELKQLGYVHARKAELRQDVFMRAVMRLIGVLAAGIYSWLFMKAIFPYSIYSSRIWLDSLSKPVGWIYFLLSLSVMIIAIHAFIVIVRLIVLRPRVFGTWDNLG